MEFYLWVDEQQQGPFTEEDLRSRVASGELSGETNAWRAGLREWMPLADVLAQEEVRAEKAKLKISKPNEPLKMTRSHSGAAPVLKVGSSTQKLAKATSAVRASTTQPLGQAAAKTVSIQGSLKRGLAADLSQTAGQTQLLTSATSNLVPHSATQAQTVRVSGATAQQYQQAEGQDPNLAAVPSANGKAVVGFVLGIISVSIAPLCFLALIGIFFSLAAKNNPHRATLNLWGIILNFIGLVFLIVGVIFMIVFWAALRNLFGLAGDAMAQGVEDMVPEQERIEKQVVEAVEEYAAENRGRAPRASEGKEIVEGLGYAEKVIYLKKGGNDVYQLQFTGEDGEFDTDDDVRLPKRIQGK